MHRFGHRVLSTIACSLLATPAAVIAQWSADPAHNLVIADRPGGEHVQPKIVALADGGFDVSRFDNAEGGYDVWLQRLDARGIAQWAPNGIRIADRAFTSTEDYGLDVDAAGYAVLAFRTQLGTDPVRISVNRVSPLGVPVWGEPGIVVSGSGASASSPRITSTSDGAIVVAWTESGVLKAQKLDPNGSALWGAGVTFVPPAGNFLLADLRAATNGDAIVSWQAQSSFNNRQYLAQKLAAADGASLWAADHVKVMDNSAGAMQLGYFPTFMHDGSGGAVFGWYLLAGVGGLVRVQHVLANGSLAFAQNGAGVSTDTTRRQYAPATTFVPATGDSYVLWRETDSTQGQIGLRAQRLDAAGTRQWGEEGRAVLPLAGFDKTQLQAAPAPDGVVFAWVEQTTPSPQTIVATRLDTAGNPLWASTTVPVKTGTTSVARLASATGSQRFLAFVWQDAAAGADAILKAQNLGYGGALGDALFADGFD